MSRSIVACLLALVLVGCGGEGDSPSTPSTQSSVPDAALEGTLGGRPFVARSALAHAPPDPSDTTHKWIDIYDVEVSCDDFFPSTDRSIIASVPWKAGTAYSFDYKQNVTFVIDDADGTPVNYLVSTGRLELVDAPTAVGAKGRLKLRASNDKAGSVEGSVDVTVCE